MRKIIGSAAVGAVVVLCLTGPVLAQPVSPADDRTDNDFSFTYDERDGEMGTQTSRRQTAEGDPVSFEVFIVASDDSGPGLTGKLKLRLEENQHTVYDGWFSLKVTGEGKVYYQRFRPAEIHLRPRPGQRTETITFRFDLPTGGYRAIGTFEGE